MGTFYMKHAIFEKISVSFDANVMRKDPIKNDEQIPWKAELAKHCCNGMTVDSWAEFIVEI